MATSAHPNSHAELENAFNTALVIGQLVSAPELRVLPTGAQLASFSLTVRSTAQPTTSVPLVWMDPPRRIEKWKAGAVVVAAGPVVRRFYRAGGATASRTEVSVRSAELASHVARAERVVERIVGALDAAKCSLTGP